MRTNQIKFWRDVFIGSGVFVALFAFLLRVLQPVGLLLASLHPATPAWRLIANWFFFWPQLVTLPGGLSLHAHRALASNVGGESAKPWALAFWCVVALAFGLGTRRRHVLTKVALAVPVMFAVAFAVLSILGLFDISPSLVGP